MAKKSNHRKNNKSRKNREMKKKEPVQYKRPSQWFNGEEFNWNDKLGDYARWFNTGGHVVAITLTEAKKQAAQAAQEAATATAIATKPEEPPKPKPDEEEPKKPEPDEEETKKPEPDEETNEEEQEEEKVEEENTSAEWKNGDPVDVSKDENLVQKYLNIDYEQVDWAELLKDENKLAQALEGKVLLINPEHVDKNGKQLQDSPDSRWAAVESSFGGWSEYYDPSDELKIELDDGSFLKATWVDPGYMGPSSWGDGDYEVDSGISRAKGCAINLCREIKDVSEGKSHDDVDPFFIVPEDFEPTYEERSWDDRTETPYIDDAFNDDAFEDYESSYVGGEFDKAYNLNEHHIPNIAEVLSKNVFLVSDAEIEKLKKNAQGLFKYPSKPSEEKEKTGTSLIESFYSDGYTKQSEKSKKQSCGLRTALISVLPYDANLSIDDFVNLLSECQVKDEYIEQFKKDATQEGVFVIQSASDAIVNLPYQILGRVCRKLAEQTIAAAEPCFWTPEFDKCFRYASRPEDREVLDNYIKTLTNEDVSISRRNFLACIGIDIAADGYDSTRFDTLKNVMTGIKRRQEEKPEWVKKHSDETFGFDNAGNYHYVPIRDYLDKVDSALYKLNPTRQASEHQLSDTEYAQLKKCVACSKDIINHPKATDEERKDALYTLNKHFSCDVESETFLDQPNRVEWKCKKAEYIPDQSFFEYPELAMLLDDIKQRR